VAHPEKTSDEGTEDVELSTLLAEYYNPKGLEDP
jgi:hypothetical protein